MNELMKTIAWTVKTPKGKITPEWTFDNKDEAEEFATELNDKYTPHRYSAVEVEISTLTVLNRKEPRDE